ncbi:MAG: hypothetical protein LBS50_10655 [Prevotellaceae bacterium]|nr:hypothetical protein [Prevotellaceae bacterium]
MQFLEIQGITKYECYQKTGIVNGVLSQKGGISEENLLKFINFYSDISLSWLFFDKGEMLRGNYNKVEKSNISKSNVQQGNNINDVSAITFGELQKSYQCIIAKKDEQIESLLEIIKNTNKS